VHNAPHRLELAAETRNGSIALRYCRAVPGCTVRQLRLGGHDCRAGRRGARSCSISVGGGAARTTGADRDLVLQRGTLGVRGEQL
jgi:hypothetical protein